MKAHFGLEIEILYMKTDENNTFAYLDINQPFILNYQ